ncbi:uncharacterized protein F5147DRAFT_693722 [Suillus discolor]|uniref:UspA domain-containing protein n=1 Tax=Suillus discolor TaxID=1912936 RepID=A0A9P7JU43_9AGAM|nr:uncharacterized protein F5147DRAFT_693722 [Suillus discolor]KAG2109030.1 hypothetical protein F5147DRAFT_693722 [Suillus discolor]
MIQSGSSPLSSLSCPDSIVVGMRGQHGMMQVFGAAGVGSMSKYCLLNSPLLIIVVRPERT